MSDALRQEVERSINSVSGGKLGIAVSGGGDSLALLHLLAATCKANGLELFAVTVDHGLRAEAAEEARFVRSVCDRLGISHDVLTWDGWDHHGNTQNEARLARYRLITDWALAKDIHAVALGHTKDDQAETFLMRLARRSGVDGLSAMTAQRTHNGILWLRPLLEVSRDDLRAYLDMLGETWVDDPTNEDLRFERIKVREKLQVLGELGINADVLAQVARNMNSAREALDVQTRFAARQLVTLRSGAVCLDWQGISDAPDEISRRLLVASLRWISGSFYPPRRDALNMAWESVCHRDAATLNGCVLRKKADKLWLIREYKAVEHLACAPDALWDGRWRVSGAGDGEHFQVKAVGEEGIAMVPNWRDTGLPRDAVLSSPAVWSGREFIAAPLISPYPDWEAILVRGEEDFFDAAFSH